MKVLLETFKDILWNHALNIDTKKRNELAEELIRAVIKRDKAILALFEVGE